ncbi:MAG: hypothetical protein IJ489_07875 [Clostridia bacterium]|nr:hypothetical protein [Clostridia bacterium]
MKKEKISNALNGIDESYVEKAANYKKKKAFMPIVKWGTLAASLAIVIAGTALIMPFLDTSVPPIITEETTSGTENLSESSTERATYTTTTTYWATTYATGTHETIYYEQYFARITEGTYKNYAPMKALQRYEILLGEKIEDVTIRGFWSTNDKTFFEESDYTGKEEIEYLRAEIYAFENISPDVAVLVKYLDKGEALTTDHYYVFVNNNVKNEIETLSDFYEIFNADHYFYVKTSADILISRPDCDDFYKTSDTLVRNLSEKLLSLEGKFLSDGEVGQMKFSKQLTFDIALDSAGAYKGYIGVFNNGYIIFHIYSTNHFSFAFDIGEENATALMSYVEENAELRRSNNYSNDKDYETTLTQTTFTGMTVETTTCTNDTACETVTSAAHRSE